jgi:manganese transport protein
MPHVIYLHSSLTTDRLGARSHGRTMREFLGAMRWDVVIALGVAAVVNLSLLLVAASGLAGVTGTETLDGVYAAITSEFGTGVALLFAVSLLGSGLASTSVGSAAGAEVMASLVRRRVPVIARRLVTAVPAVIVIALGAEPGAVLVLSQVALSMGIPFALIPLVVLTSRRSVMGTQANARAVTAVAAAIAGGIVVLNVVLLVRAAGDLLPA